MAFITEPELQRLREVKDYAQKNILTIKQAKAISEGASPYLSEMPAYNGTVNKIKYCFAIQKVQTTKNFPFKELRWLTFKLPKSRYHLTKRFINAIIAELGFERKVGMINLWIEHEKNFYNVTEPVNFNDLNTPLVILL